MDEELDLEGEMAHSTSGRRDVTTQAGLRSLKIAQTMMVGQIDNSVKDRRIRKMITVSNCG